MPLWLIRFAPHIGAALLFVSYSVWLYGNGQSAERRRWEAKEAAAQMALQEREDEMQAQVDAAGATLSAQSAEIERLSGLAQRETKVYYNANPAANVVCLSPDRLRSVSESDAAPAEQSGTSR